MSNPEERACIDLVSLASFERQIGFEHVADEYLAIASRCDGCNCRSPFNCNAANKARNLEAGRVVPIVRAPSGVSPARMQPSSSGARLIEMRAERDRIDDQAGNWIERVMRPLGALRGNAADPNLSALFEYWESLWATSRASLADIDPIRFGQLGWLGRLHLVDASHADPRRFHFQIRGQHIPAVRGASREGVPIGQNPHAALAASVANDYDRVRRTRQPLYGRVRCLLGGVPYRYERLILPLSSAGKQVNRLLVAIKMDQSSSDPAAGARVRREA